MTLLFKLISTYKLTLDSVFDAVPNYHQISLAVYDHLAAKTYQRVNH